MSAEIEQRTVIINRTTRLSREEMRWAIDDIERILQRLGLVKLTGEFIIRTNQGGICEISYNERTTHLA